MRRALLPVLLVGGLAIVAAAGVLAVAADKKAAKKERKAFGLEKRERWTTSRVVGSPDPPPPYRLEKAYPDLGLKEPLELSIVPGSDRWVVAERYGKIFTFA